MLRIILILGLALQFSRLREQPAEFPLHYFLPERHAAFVHEDRLSRAAAVPFPARACFSLKASMAI